MLVDEFIKNLGTYYRDSTIVQYDRQSKKYEIGFTGSVIRQFLIKNSDLANQYNNLFKIIIETYPRTYKNAPGIYEIKKILKEIPEKRRVTTKIKDFFPTEEVKMLFKNRTKFI